MDLKYEVGLHALPMFAFVGDSCQAVLIESSSKVGKELEEMRLEAMCWLASFCMET